MEEAQARQGPPAREGFRGDWAWLGVALLLTAALRFWMLWHTEVTARDSIGYIRYALEFENLSWSEVLCQNHQHPGYPLAILAASYPVRAVLGLTTYAMQLSAQLASFLAALLLVVPMFYLGKWWWDRQIGFWAALLFQFLPVSAHHLSDGISEAWFLFLSTTAVWAATYALQSRSPRRFGLCGLCCGLAYLTRPEGALVLIATALVLLGCQFVSSWRRSWTGLLACGFSLSVAALAIGSLYFGFTWRFTNKISVNHILILGEQASLPECLGRKRGQAPFSQALAPLLLGRNCEKGACPLFRQPQLLWANLFAANVKKTDSLTKHLGQGLAALVMELTQSFHYFGWLPALAGLWWFRGVLGRFPGPWVAVVLCVLQSLVLCLLVAKMSYVSDRHVMWLVLYGCYPAVATLRELPRRFGAWRGEQTRERAGRWRWEAILIVLLIGLCLPRTLQPLHGNRAGHHAAGLWLAQRLQGGDVVKDDHCWAHYFAGQVFQEGKDMVIAPGYHPICYYVISRSRDPEVHLVRSADEARLEAAQGKLVFHWPAECSSTNAKVVVYAVPQAD